MGDTKHTAGPWLVSPFKAVVTTGEFGNDGDFLPVAAMLWPTDERTEAETYANAHLISAAPDLYEALDWALAEAEGRTRYSPDFYSAKVERESALDKARAALAKAHAGIA